MSDVQVTQVDLYQFLQDVSISGVLLCKCVLSPLASFSLTKCWHRRHDCIDGSPVHPCMMQR